MAENEERNDMPCDLIEAEKSEAQLARENFERSLQGNIWGYSETGMQARRAAMTMLSTKTGMYARIPLICKADDCPYKDNCSLLPHNLAPFGEYCPIETAQIELRYNGYAQDFQLDTTASFTDKCLVNEIIHLDIMLERCKALMAKEGVPVVEVVAGIAENGEVYNRPEVSKFFEAYINANKKRMEIYQLMMATRRDKKKDGEEEKGIHEIIKEAINTNDFIIDERPPELGEVQNESGTV